MAVVGNLLFPLTSPPMESAPDANAYTSPVPAFRGVTNSVPPANEEASPIDEIVTSMSWPILPNGGSLAVTITAATFLELSSCLGFSPSF